MEASGQLTDPKWGEITAEQLIDTLVNMIGGENRHATSSGSNCPRKIGNSAPPGGSPSATSTTRPPDA
jgi:hypothetical protein